MVLFMVLVLVLIGAAIIAGVFAVINPFVAELGNIQRYNQAYYGAIAGVERAELVLRGHTAGFEGSGGWLGNNNFGNQSDYKITDFTHFGFLSLKQFGNGITWSIKSMTNGTVPEPGKGNLDPDISSGNDYIKLDFEKALQYALYKDTTSELGYYTGVKDDNIENIQIDGGIDVSIRTPFRLTCAYNSPNGNCNSSSRDNTWTLVNSDNNDLDGNGISNDIIVNRTLFGYTGDTQFTIFPTVDVDTTNNSVNTDDTTIREDVINGYVSENTNINYDTTNGSLDTNPNNVGTHTDNINEFNQSPDQAVSTGFDFVLNTNYGDNFSNSKASGKIGKMNLKFSLVNVPEYSKTKVYPYLEVKLQAKKAGGDKIPIPDLNFHITGEGKVIDYDVKILISKPVFDSTAASDFTILF